MKINNKSWRQQHKRGDRIMRTSVINYNEAVNEVKEWFKDRGLEWNGKKYVGDYSVEERSADCEAFPCPRGLDTWSGEISAIYICNEDCEELFAVAYWE